MAGSGPTPGQTVAAVLLPPLGVFLRRGLGPAFWTDVALTLLGWVPGIIFALITLFRVETPARA